MLNPEGPEDVLLTSEEAVLCRLTALFVLIKYTSWSIVQADILGVQQLVKFVFFKKKKYDLAISQHS